MEKQIYSPDLTPIYLVTTENTDIALFKSLAEDYQRPEYKGRSQIMAIFSSNYQLASKYQEVLNESLSLLCDENLVSIPLIRKETVRTRISTDCGPVRVILRNTGSGYIDLVMQSDYMGVTLGYSIDLIHRCMVEAPALKDYYMAELLNMEARI